MQGERETARSGEAEETRAAPGICSKPDIEMVGRVFSMLDMQKDKNIRFNQERIALQFLDVIQSCRGKIKFNTLSNRKNVEGALPWNKSEKLREWTNIDNEYLIYYMETYYLLNSDKKILAALEMAADVNKFNPFIDMLTARYGMEFQE